MPEPNTRSRSREARIKITEFTYSVTQSLANSFWGYVVLDSFINVSRDEDNILDQIYIEQMCSDFSHEDLKFWEWSKKMHI